METSIFEELFGKLYLPKREYLRRKMKRNNKQIIFRNPKTYRDIYKEVVK